MTFERGDVVLIPFPFTDLSSLKQRPVLVLSHRAYNGSSPDFIVCGITSVLSGRPHAIPLLPTDMARGSLPLESRIRADKIFTLHQSLVKRRLGRVKPGVLAEVKKELLSLLN